MTTSTMQVAGVVFCVCLSAVVAQIPSFGSCPKDIQAQDTFNVTRYLGRWYELYRFPTVFEFGQTCASANYTLLDNGHLAVHNSGYTDGKLKDIHGDAYCPDETYPARLGVRFSTAQPYGAYWVVETDYDNYSLVYSCGPLLGLAHVEMAWLLTRRPELEQATVDRLFGRLKQGGVNTGHFSKTPQDNCPTPQ